MKTVAGRIIALACAISALAMTGLLVLLMCLPGYEGQGVHAWKVLYAHIEQPSPGKPATTEKYLEVTADGWLAYWTRKALAGEPPPTATRSRPGKYESRIGQGGEIVGGLLYWQVRYVLYVQGGRWVSEVKYGVSLLGIALIFWAIFVISLLFPSTRRGLGWWLSRLFRFRDPRVARRAGFAVVTEQQEV